MRTCRSPTTCAWDKRSARAGTPTSHAARREFLDSVVQAVSASADGITVVFSSHLVADLERTCGYLILLAGGQVRLAGPVDALLAGSAHCQSLDDLVVSYLREVPR